MIRGLYSAAAGMLSAQLSEGVVANNVANTQTPGYKATASSISSFGLQGVELVGAASGGLPQAPTPLASVGSGAMVDATTLEWQEGPLSKSDNPLASAIRGAGLFAVRNGAGTRYTRSGDFHLDARGVLVTSSGLPVLGPGGRPVTVPSGTGTVTITADGTLMRAGAAVGRVGVYLPPAGSVEPVGGGLYAVRGGVAVPQVTPSLRPGFLEGPNVDVVGQMAALLQIQQTFASDVQAMQVANQTIGTALNQVGTVS